MNELLKGLHVTEMMAADIPFLLDLWQREDVMRYADEFPHPRGWTRRDDVETAWAGYRQGDFPVTERMLRELLFIPCLSDPVDGAADVVLDILRETAAAARNGDL